MPTGVGRTLANVAYAELCDVGLSQPVKVHDVIRFVEQKYAGDPRYSINVALSQDPRFCWGGRALYGLARHGVMPGVRSLAEAAYAVLLAAPRDLHVEEVDFVLEQMNYRFNTDSLLHHLRGYTWNKWGLTFQMTSWNRVHVSSGRDARHQFNTNIGVSPTHTGFDLWLEEDLVPRVEQALADRTDRLRELAGEDLDVGGDRVEFE